MEIQTDSISYLLTISNIYTYLFHKPSKFLRMVEIESTLVSLVDTETPPSIVGKPWYQTISVHGLQNKRHMKDGVWTDCRLPPSPKATLAPHGLSLYVYNSLALTP